MNETLKGHTYIVQQVSFNPDGKLLASGWDNTIKLWEIPSGKFITNLSAQETESDGSETESGGSSSVGEGYYSCDLVCTCIPVK